MLVGVVANHEEIALGVIQEPEVHLRNHCNLAGQARAGSHTILGQCFDCGDSRLVGRGPLAELQLRQLPPALGRIQDRITARWQRKAQDFSLQIQTLRMQGLAPEIGFAVRFGGSGAWAGQSNNTLQQVE
ncbi:hypothetical protein D3C81_397980 [compost metagenome]